MIDYENRSLKAHARALMFADCDPIRSLVTLPGRDIVCVRMMRDLGLIDATTRQVWVERDLTKIEAMRDNAIALGYRDNVTIRSGDIRDFAPEAPFDFLNLDLEEGFTPKLGSWFEAMADQALADTATIIVTLTASSRNFDPGQFASWFDRIVPQHALLRETHAFLRAQATHSETIPVCRAALLIACALTGHQVNLTQSFAYADKMPMLTFRLHTRRRSEVGALPRFSVLRQAFEQQHTPRTWEVSDERRRDLDQFHATIATNRAIREAHAQPRGGIVVSEIERRKLAIDDERAALMAKLAALDAEEARLSESDEDRYRRVRHEAAVKAAATRKARRQAQQG